MSYIKLVMQCGKEFLFSNWQITRIFGITVKCLLKLQQQEGKDFPKSDKDLLELIMRIQRKNTYLI